MAGRLGMFGTVQKIRSLSSIQRRFTAGKVVYKQPTSRTTAPVAEMNVPGLSENVVKVTSEPLGPGASKTTNYKNPEYFSYSNTSYFEAEVEMLQYRCPQPSSKKPHQ